jgi:hypothetical protein
VQIIETGFAEWFYASHTMGPAQILLKISTRIDLPNDITLNPHLFSLVNTFKKSKSLPSKREVLILEFIDNDENDWRKALRVRVD